MPVSFDRAADFYDQTRGYPPEVQERIGRALIDAAGATPHSRILELGVGTGRIALPIIRAGYPYTGIDLSTRMMDRLRAALPAIPGAQERVTLVEGDITALPFADRSFDVVLSVHVFHLVADRAGALAESMRVLDRPGVALNGRDDSIDPPGQEAGDAWREILHGLGWELPPEEKRDAAHYLAEEWTRLGGVVDEIDAVEHESVWRPSGYVEGLAQRIWSGTWSIPEQIYPEAIRQLRAWAEHHYGDALDTPVPYRRRFIIERARFA